MVPNPTGSTIFLARGRNSILWNSYRFLVSAVRLHRTGYVVGMQPEIELSNPRVRVAPERIGPSRTRDRWLRTTLRPRQEAVESSSEGI